MVNMENTIINGKGINAVYKDGSWTIDANSGAVIIDNIIPHVGDAIAKGETIQTVFDKLFSDILPRIPIVDHASMFKTNDDGLDSEHPEVTGLNKNAIYIRITFVGSNEPLYISCWLLQSDIEALKELVNSKASKSEYDLLREQLDEKVSAAQIELLNEQLKLKADKTQLEKLQSIVDKKANTDYIASIEQSIYNKADKSSLTSLETTVANINKTLESVAGSDDIEDITEAIGNINESLLSKATKTDFENVVKNIEKKADKTYVDDLAKRFDSIEEINLDGILTKLNSITLSVSNLDKKITTNETNLKKKADLSYVENIDTELKKATTKLDIIVETKADKTELTSKANKKDLDAIAQTNTLINNSVTNIRKEVDNKASKSDLTEKYEELRHIISDNLTLHRNDIRTVNTKITSLEKKVVAVESSVKDINDLAKREWIQVLTPEQYKRIPSTRIDPAKLYMCIKFGKPYALYIGSVLIAERNVEESTGFAYTFPLTF